MTSRRAAYSAGKPNEDNSMPPKQERAEDMYASVLQLLCAR